MDTNSEGLGRCLKVTLQTSVPNIFRLYQWGDERTHQACAYWERGPPFARAGFLHVAMNDQKNNIAPKKRFWTPSLPNHFESGNNADFTPNFTHNFILGETLTLLFVIYWGTFKIFSSDAYTILYNVEWGMSDGVCLCLDI